jgi:hypothetical protein
VKTITVKGIGRVSAPVDTVELSFHVCEKNKDYEKAMNGASDKVDALEQALVKAGFPAADFQSAGFHVHMEYESVRDKNGEYRNAFAGYVCSYDQRLRFDFDTGRLGEALDAAAESKALPELNVSFTVREPDRLQEELLEKGGSRQSQGGDPLPGLRGPAGGAAEDRVRLRSSELPLRNHDGHGRRSGSHGDEGQAQRRRQFPPRGH